MQSKTLVGLFLCLWIGAGAAAGEDLAELVGRNTHELKLGDGRLTGPGAEWLRPEAKTAHFFMLGEQHATAGIAELSTALYRELSSLGYDHAAVESGPWSTPILERLLRSDSPAAFEDYLAASDAGVLTFPFFFFAEELEFARTVIGLSDAASGALWGVDQEFIAGAGPLLELLEAWAGTPGTRAAVAAARESSRSDPMYLAMGPDESWQTLTDAFRSEGDDRAVKLLEEIEISRRIYAPFVGKGGSVYSANEERERYMKTKFDAALKGAEEELGRTPKVFLKFGANHVSYGHSPTHVRTLGSFVDDIAWSRGLRAFNLHVDCLGGEVRDPRSGETGACSSYFLGEGGALAEYVASDKLTLIDLRSLRPHTQTWSDLDEASRNLILAYDALLVMPKPRAATVIGP